ncbi:Bgt-4399 [Blumeria graminis f. sp. tritici]|uniref:glucan endo-1,3-beta-D-glucosidase n=2 Tax=Blumeria graminis f. sp. tritici TaxID=62690 RepID=A0A381LDX4_BLUGR|nr:hypothetical protein BGT96224_4399 [Blumeria graminis f. sp. tritici 96224]VDB93247.1 Bgt-4399 [Blumeria graminis f. sp. tritici]
MVALLVALIISAAMLKIVVAIGIDLCALNKTEENGNLFCQPVQAIRYSNVGTNGSYQEIIDMSSDGICTKRLKFYNGSLAPLNEELSLHFRGPIHLMQLATYSTSMPTQDQIFKLHTAVPSASGNLNIVSKSGALSPQILANVTIPSDSEVIVMSGKTCQEGDCGYVRPGSVAYHGFGGPNKIFLMEFMMPRDDKRGFNGDMPAIWLLNAQIVRTLQYGKGECSCWRSGCGEFDVAESLSSGSSFLKSTLHINQLAGDSDYIRRPLYAPMKLAVVFNQKFSSIQIQVLSQEFAFSRSISMSAIDELLKKDANSLSQITVI